MNGEVPGSYNAEELAALPGFSMTTLVCQASGEIAEKNWRRAGEFGDVASVLMTRDSAPSQPPPPPAATTAAAAASASSDVDALIDSAGTKLFSHVADLMKELENRREEKGLISSLQRHIAALKEELAQTRERSNLLELRLPRLVELEEAQRKAQAELESLQSGLLTRDQALNEARIAAEKNRNEADAAKRRLQETINDLAVRNRLVDKLSKELSEKELSLAKSLGLIRRLEEDLNRLCPNQELMAQPAAAPAPEPEALSPLRPAQAAHPAASPPPALASYTLDEPSPAPPYLESMPESETPKAQQALTSFLKRIFPEQKH
jgi:hypothetical protein